jgi:hypothetical protein
MQCGRNLRNLGPIPTAKHLDGGGEQLHPASRKHVTDRWLAARYETYKTLGRRVVESFDVQGSDFNDLQFYIVSSTSNIIDRSITFSGGFTVNNPALENHIDQFLGQNFSTNIRVPQNELPQNGLGPIWQAKLACACIELLCSRSAMTEQVYTVLDRITVPNNFRRGSLTARFEDLLLSRLPRLIDRVLYAVRTITNQQYRVNVYAAAAVLWYNLDFFRNSLNHGYLRGCVSEVL